MSHPSRMISLNIFQLYTLARDATGKVDGGCKNLKGELSKNLSNSNMKNDDAQ